MEKTPEDKNLTGKERKLITDIVYQNERILRELNKQIENLVELESHSPIKQHETFGVYHSKVGKLIETATILRRHIINILVEDKLYGQIKACIDKMEKDLKKV